jgi:hypothetical protein
MLNTGVSGETREPNEEPFEERMFRGEVNALPTAKTLLDASSLDASMGGVNDLPELWPISDPANFTCGGCGFGSLDRWDDA